MPSFVAPLTGRIDVALSNYAKKFRNNALVSDLVFSRVGVPNQTDKYWKFDRENQELIEQDLRGTGAAAQQVRMALSTDSYTAASHALAAPLTQEDRANWKLPGSLEQAATRTLIDKILLAKEKRFADLVSDTAKVTNNVTLTGTNQWSDAASLPISDVETGKSTIRKAGVQPNIMVIGEPVFVQLIKHAKVIERFQYVQAGSIGENELAAVFAIPRVVVARAVWVNKSGTADFLFGKHALLAYVDPASSMDDISFGKSFVWEGAPGTVGGLGTIIGPMGSPSAKSDELSVDFYYDQKITAVETGYLIKNAVA